jgi:hypothetical protein
VIFVLLGFILPLIAGITLKQRIRKKHETYWTIYSNHPKTVAVSIALIESLALVVAVIYIIFLSPILVVEVIGFSLAAFICAGLAVSWIGYLFVPMMVVWVGFGMLVAWKLSLPEIKEDGLQ